jgi:hypothetical protein
VSATARELRDLASQIETLARKSPCYSVVCKIVQVMCENICAVARIHELNERDK